MKKTVLATTNHLKKLEEQLLQPKTRKSIEELSTLLADEFIEFGSSGTIFNKQQIINTLLTESQVHYSLADFKTVLLAADVILVTYRIIKNDKNKIVESLRSSIWKFHDNHWQMIFHQGTLINPS